MRIVLFAALALCACANGPDVSPSPADYGALRFSEGAADQARFAALAAEVAERRNFDWNRPVAELPDRNNAEEFALAA